MFSRDLRGFLSELFFGVTNYFDYDILGAKGSCVAVEMYLFVPGENMTEGVHSGGDGDDGVDNRNNNDDPQQW